MKKTLRDLLDVYLRDTDRADKYRRGSNCAMAALALPDILKEIDSKKE